MTKTPARLIPNHPDDPADSLRVLTAEGIELLFSGLKGITVGEVSTRWSWFSDDATENDLVAKATTITINHNE